MQTLRQLLLQLHQQQEAQTQTGGGSAASMPQPLETLIQKYLRLLRRQQAQRQQNQQSWSLHAGAVPHIALFHAMPNLRRPPTHARAHAPHSMSRQRDGLWAPLLGSIFIPPYGLVVVDICATNRTRSDPVRRR
jgi:hypothetical protein